jgi:hypothetical protein
VEWQAADKGTYVVRVRDLEHNVRGGPEFLYRLSIRRAEPDFELSLGTDYVNVVQGGKAEMDLTVRRTGGFHGPIDLVLEGLPNGVRAETTRIPQDQDRAKLTLVADAGARPCNAPVRVFARAAIGKNGPRQHAVRVVPVAGSAGVCGELSNDLVQLTVQHKPLFRITCNEAYQYAPRGTVYPYLVKVERLDGFDGPITLQICDRQVQDLDGIEVVERVVPPGTKEIGALIYLPETMHANVQHHCRPYVQGYASFTDRWRQHQSMLALCDKRCMIRTLPTVVKLRALESELTCRPGETVACNLSLERTSNFGGPMEVELVEPRSQMGIQAAKVQVEAGQASFSMPVRVAPTMTRSSTALKFRAVGTMPGVQSVISEATMELKVQ